MAGLGRAFVAVVPPPTVRDALADAIAGVVGPPLRPTAPERWHVTLRFLGAVPDVDTLVAGLADVAATHAAPTGIRCGGAGSFPDGPRGTAVWVGVDGGDALPDLAAAVDRTAVGLGVPEEPRPFRAHLTVARTGRSAEPPVAALAAAVDSSGAATAPWTATELVVVASHPAGGHHRHTVVARLPLASP